MIYLPSSGELDADWIFWDLWQGSKPPRGELVKKEGFDVLVLCAVEYQPPKTDFPGVEVVYAGFQDNFWHGPTETELKTAQKAAKIVAKHIKAGKRVLVTCQAGLNRSGLVTALAMHLLTGVEGRSCQRWIQARRENALFNNGFTKVLSQLEGKPHEELVKWELDRKIKP